MGNFKGGAYPSSFISTEWFFSRKKPAQATEQEEGLYTWIYKNIRNGKLREDSELTDKPVSLRGTTAAPFLRNSKQVDDIESEFQKDLKQYQSIFMAEKSALSSFGKAQRGLTGDLQRIASPSTEWDKVRDTILKYEDKATAFSGDKTLAKKFKEPTYEFLGDYTTPFLTKNKMFDTGQMLVQKAEVELPALNDSDIEKLINLAREFDSFSFELQEFEDDVIGFGWDLTDSPTRGFMDEVTSDSRVMNVLNVFSEHGMVVEEHNAGSISILRERVENLTKALWTYIRRSVK